MSDPLSHSCPTCNDKGVLGGCGRDDCDHMHTLMFCNDCNPTWTQPAVAVLTPADVLTYVRTLPGVDRRWRCAEHGGDFLEKSPSKYALCLTMLYEDAWNALPEPEPCKPIRVLIVPLSEEE